MKRLLPLFVLALAVCSAHDLTGKWDVTATPDGKQPIQLNADLTHSGTDLTGTVSSLLGSGPVKNAQFGDPGVTFQFMLGKHTFDVKAETEAGRMRGTFKGPGFMKGTFLARRADAGGGAGGPAAEKVAPEKAAPAEGVDVGTLGNAQYRIDIPKNYNGSLVVYCHGYAPAPARFDKTKKPTAVLQAFLDLGYAVAQSGYSQGGWAVEQAMAETEALRQHFIQTYGKPKRTFVTGHSMGGAITLALSETFPEAYDAALQMCGPTGAVLTMMQERMFDTLVVYDWYFPDIIGSPVKISDEVSMAPEFLQRIQKEATQYPERLAALQKWGNFQSDAELSQVIAFYALIQKELMARAGGNPFDNRNTVYQGTGSDAQLNREAKRFASDAAAVEYLRKYFTPKGNAKLPVLSLHTTYDPLVPAVHANAYGALARLNGGEANYVQRYVARNGHCTFTPQETAHAFQDLVTWKETGKRPAPGEQK